ncbi:hypothetical protein B0H13DRAFT_1663956 [Mycena leptocephala]|nr:hypothetical protein B0H13DRAFT_1663956 [Mycena leptocephala]
MTSNSTGVPLLPNGEKFDGTGFTGWKTKLIALAKARGQVAYLDGTVPRPPAAAPMGTTPLTVGLPPEPTPVYSMRPSREEWDYRDAATSALVVLDIKNPVGLGLKLDSTAHEAMKSLEDIHNQVTGMG